MREIGARTVAMFTSANLVPRKLATVAKNIFTNLAHPLTELSNRGHRQPSKALYIHHIDWAIGMLLERPYADCNRTRAKIAENHQSSKRDMQHWELSRIKT